MSRGTEAFSVNAAPYRWTRQSFVRRWNASPSISCSSPGRSWWPFTTSWAWGELLVALSCRPSTGRWWSWLSSPSWRKSCFTTHTGGDHRCVKMVLLRAFHQQEHLPLSSLRLFHQPHLYKRFHKQHHEWTAPIGLVATYAHPLEHVVGGQWHRLQGSTSGHLAMTNTNICSSSLLQLSNLMPVVIGPVILGSHVSTTCMWYCVALISTTISHCGYHLPFLPSPEFHDFHHLRCVHFSILFINFFFFFKTYISALSWNQDNGLQIWDLQQLPTFPASRFNQCFGVFGVLDRLHGTDDKFRQSKQYERHVLLTSLTPLNESIPDTPKKALWWPQRLASPTAGSFL